MADVPKYLCKICEKWLSAGAYNVKRHNEMVHGDKKFKCEKCSKLLSSKQSLENHVKTRHSKSNTSMFTCIRCSRHYHTKEGLKYHGIREHGDPSTKSYLNPVAKSFLLTEAQASGSDGSEGSDTDDTDLSGFIVPENLVEYESSSPEKTPRKNKKKPQNNKFCTKCGHKFRSGDNFCGKCGYKVGQQANKKRRLISSDHDENVEVKFKFCSNFYCSSTG